MFGSALVHGIYAADARKLSVKAAFPMLWEAEEKGRGSIVRGMSLRRNVEEKEEESYILGDLVSRMEGVSVYSFQDGMETITKALTRYLENKSNVRLLAGVSVDSLRVNIDNKNFEVKLYFFFGFLPHPLVLFLIFRYEHPVAKFWTLRILYQHSLYRNSIPLSIHQLPSHTLPPTQCLQSPS